jgi:hypothetical protein
MENQLPEQRQYSLEEVLSITFNIIKKHWLKFVLIGLIVYTPLMIIANLVDKSYLMNLFPKNILDTYPKNFGNLYEMISINTPIYYFSLALMLFGFIVNFAIAVIVQNCANGEEPKLKNSLTLALKKFPIGFLTTILAVIFMCFLSIPLFIPAIIFAVYWTFYLIAIMLRNRRGIDALRYSYYVVKGRWWRVLGYSIVFALIAGVATWIPSGIAQLFMKVPYMMSLSTLISSTIQSFTMIAGTVFFLNLESTSKFLVRKPIGEEIPTLPGM